MTPRTTRAITLTLIALIVASPAHAQFGNIRKKLEEKAKEAVAKKAGVGADTASRPGAAQPAPGAPMPGQSPAAADPVPEQSGAAASGGASDDRSAGRIPVYPGAKLAIPQGGSDHCCSFGTTDPVEKVLAFYAERLGPGLPMDAFEAKYPSARQMTGAMRNAGMKAVFFGKPRDMGGMLDMSPLFVVMDHPNGRVFDLRIRQLDGEGMVHVRQFIRDALRIPPITIDAGPNPPAAAEEVASEGDMDLRLSQAVLDRYLAGRAAEAAEAQRQQGLYDRYRPQLQQCAERVGQALRELDQSFIQDYCGGTLPEFPAMERVGAKAAGMKSYQYARLFEHISAYYRIRTEKGARGVRQQDWKMWDAEAFAVLERNWDRIAAAHRDAR